MHVQMMNFANKISLFLIFEVDRFHHNEHTAYSLTLGHIKKKGWLASPPAHKKSPAQDFLKFFI
jgi:hypothetical protein